MKKRLFGILLSFALMLTMMPVLGLNQTAYAKSADQYPPLWVGGVQVTETNKDNVLSDGLNNGKVSYTPAADGNPAKLTLNGANITTGSVHGTPRPTWGFLLQKGA